MEPTSEAGPSTQDSSLHTSSACHEDLTACTAHHLSRFFRLPTTLMAGPRRYSDEMRLCCVQARRLLLALLACFHLSQNTDAAVPRSFQRTETRAASRPGDSLCLCARLRKYSAMYVSLWAASISYIVSLCLLLSPETFFVASACIYIQKALAPIDISSISSSDLSALLHCSLTRSHLSTCKYYCVPDASRTHLHVVLTSSVSLYNHRNSTGARHEK